MPKAPDNFAQIYPDHPHRRAHILFSILAFVLVAGSIIVYQIKMSEPRGETSKESYGEVRQETEFTQAYWDKKIEDARVSELTTTTITDEQWKAKIEEARQYEKNNQNN